MNQNNAEAATQHPSPGEDFESVYAISAALDHPLPAPYGSQVIEVTIVAGEYSQVYPVFEGRFATTEDADIEIARWIVVQEGERDECPWEDDKAFMQKHDPEDEGDADTLAKLWYGSKTPADIVYGYFGDNGNSDLETLEMSSFAITKPRPWRGAGEA